MTTAEALLPLIIFSPPRSFFPCAGYRSIVKAEERSAHLTLGLDLNADEMRILVEEGVEYASF